MKLTPLFEITYSDAPQVDRDAGVIRGVRILGRASRNGREYSDAALQQAARLYEGLGVNLNHSEHPQTGGIRTVEDGFGWLESIDVRADGVYGNLHYFRAHPQADVIVEAAVRNPRRFGLSHHAEGSVARRMGKLVVESIETVRSVDIVQNPATSNGLFESENMNVNHTVREILEEEGDRFAGLVSAPELQRAADQPVALSETASRDDRIETAVQVLLVALLENEDLDLATRLRLAGRLLEAHAAPADERPLDDDAPSLAELLERIERVENETRCRALLESANRAADPARVEQLAALTTDQERLRLIESWPDRDAGRARGSRPAASRPLFETRNDPVRFPQDVKSFVAAIR
jgi:hypothetical protein